MPTAYILVGVPGSGKSTWINRQHWAKDCVIASTDNFVEAYARSVNKTYNEVFHDVMKNAVALMADTVVKAVCDGRDIIWDQTSTSIASRKKKLKMLDGYTKIAVVFKTPEKAEWERRIKSRPGKDIPQHVLSSMSNNFEHPTLEEGFDQVWHAE